MNDVSWWVSVLTVGFSSGSFISIRTYFVSVMGTPTCISPPYYHTVSLIAVIISIIIIVIIHVLCLECLTLLRMGERKGIWPIKNLAPASSNPWRLLFERPLWDLAWPGIISGKMDQLNKKKKFESLLLDTNRPY